MLETLIKQEHLDMTVSESPKSSKLKKINSTTNNKTIKAPGTASERVAQACDRCRAKKIKCDGRNPCSGCQTVGLECIVSDRLSRRAFPKGYTETLEERIRQLEAENKKLVGLLDLRDEQLALNVSSENDNQTETLTSSNLNLHNHTHLDGCPCGCLNPHEVHERPVSIVGSMYGLNTTPLSIAGSINLSDEDLEFTDEETNSMVSEEVLSRTPSHRLSTFGSVNPAPGAFAAATAIAQMQKNRVFQQQQEILDNETSKQQRLTALVAISIPRSTEETLFIPTLLARVCQVYGFNSKPLIITANAIASLKEAQEKDINMESLKIDAKNPLSFIRDLQLPTSRIDLDHLITVYFQDWRNSLPILDKNTFLKNYVKLTSILEAETSESFDQLEKYGATLVLVISLSLLSNKNIYLGANPQYSTLLSHYDYLIHEFIKPSCIITKNCLIQSLQILSLALQYCLVIGDTTTCYELRGRVVTMAQQLRLHRCPAAVLGISSGVGGAPNVNLQNLMQGERRILFWCIYCLDIYSSLNLGVPRLLKDFEIECALPFASKNDDDDRENENILIINNTRLSIVGKVTKLALSSMLYCKVLGTILDSIFSRFESGTDVHTQAVHRDSMLDCWRRDLPAELKFEIDINGFSLKDNIDEQSWKSYTKQQLTLIFMYYHAKILIYLPIISKYGNHLNVGLSQKEQLSKSKSPTSIVSSVSMIQQALIQILELLKCLVKFNSLYLLPIPVNIPREQARIALLVAKGSLDYIKGGTLHQTLKQLLLDTVAYLSVESGFEVPGNMTKNSSKLLELSILSILGMNKPLKKKAPVQTLSVAAAAREPQDPNFRKTSPLSNVVRVLPVEDKLDLDSILKFDPFKINLGRENYMDEFAADGSLGLVPFLDLALTDIDSYMAQDMWPQDESKERLERYESANKDTFDWL